MRFFALASIAAVASGVMLENEVAVDEPVMVEDDNELAEINLDDEILAQMTEHAELFEFAEGMNFCAKGAAYDAFKSLDTSTGGLISHQELMRGLAKLGAGRRTRFLIGGALYKMYGTNISRAEMFNFTYALCKYQKKYGIKSVA